ncbi:3-hydroxyisobutyrate dehydrogenase [Ignatzschineria sp. F8392]|nr:NAD(P)-dependent oxidoreductase [Ignatzschineria sp. F8392]OYQ81885.1 3-hydroxyisobutyrate dehydrogenase [Ignatzschineria sp. F8392]
MDQEILKDVAIIGLGNMGLGMAKNLLSKGYRVSGFDLSEAARNSAMDAGVKILPVEELIAGTRILLLSLPKAEHVLDCSNEIEKWGEKGLVVIDTSTSTPDVTRTIYQRFIEKEMLFVDAPVSGGPKGALTGTMTMVVGADRWLFEALKPLLEAMSSTQVHVGKAGAGNIVKICNNLLIAAHLITTAEALSLATKAGVEPEAFFAGINRGSGRSAASEVNFPLWILNGAFNSGFTMGLMRKDVGLAESLMEKMGMELPLSQEIIALWEKSRTLLEDHADFNEIVKQSDSKIYG